ncbi:hypothetical protein F4680DRAFT_444782 [Xylaria scruposa]|nr:hypothetical protein F4680DRAFT_444782 [Xylaria scruposa]
MASSPDNTYVDHVMVELANAPEDIVRAVLIALCQDSEQEQKAKQYFKSIKWLKSEELGRDENSGIDGSNGVGDVDSRIAEGEPKRKRAASDIIRICEECKEAFSVDDNPSDACEFHTGSLEMNDESSVWDDWEDWRSGDRFSKETEEEFPQGFTWDCCNKRGDSPGCTRGSHSAQDKRLFRGGADRS